MAIGIGGAPKLGDALISAIQLNADYEMLEFLMQVQGTSASQLPVSGNSGIASLGDQMDVGGTTAAMWDNAPYWSAPGDSEYFTKELDFLRWFSLADTAATGKNLMMMFHMKFAAHPPAQEQIFDSRSLAPTGGYRITMKAGQETLEVRVVDAAGDDGLAVAVGAPDYITNTLLSCGVHFDVCAATPKITMIVNAGEDSADQSVLLPGYDDIRNDAFFSSYLGLENLNLSGTSDQQLSCMRWVKAPSAVSESVWRASLLEMQRLPFGANLRALG